VSWVVTPQFPPRHSWGFLLYFFSPRNYNPKCVFVFFPSFVEFPTPHPASPSLTLRRNLSSPFLYQNPVRVFFPFRAGRRPGFHFHDVLCFRPLDLCHSSREPTQHLFRRSFFGKKGRTSSPARSLHFRPSAERTRMVFWS